jgi:hypothetical protein
VAKSLYKGERLGKRPPCLICMGPGEGERGLLHLPGGVSVWLCGAHRSAGFLTRRAGRDLCVSLMRAWEAAGCMTRARHRALDAHLARVAVAPARGRPGSYAWPRLRRQAERRFAAGEAPARVIGELLGGLPRGPATAPSRRTMLRWFREGRWSAATGRGRPRGGRPPVGLVPMCGQCYATGAVVGETAMLIGAPVAYAAFRRARRALSLPDTAVAPTAPPEGAPRRKRDPSRPAPSASGVTA